MKSQKGASVKGRAVRLCDFAVILRRCKIQDSFPRNASGSGLHQLKIIEQKSVGFVSGVLSNPEKSIAARF